MKRDPAIATLSQLCWENVTAGMALPSVTLPVTYTAAIQNVAAGRDYMRGHHEPAYARRQGQPEIFVSFTFHQCFVDRVVTDWAGPLAFITRRRMQMADPIVAGDTLHAEARVLSCYEDDQGRGLADVVVNVSNGRARCTLARVTVRLPRLESPFNAPGIQ